MTTFLLLIIILLLSYLTLLAVKYTDSIRRKGTMLAEPHDYTDLESIPKRKRKK